MAEQLHLIVVNEGDYGWSLSSPQLSGFVYGREAFDEFKADLDGALAFANAPLWPQVIHQLRRFTSPEGTSYVVQVADTARQDGRLSVLERLTTLLDAPTTRSQLLARSSTQTGDVQFICALPTDQIGWLADQTFEGDTVTVVAPLSEPWLWFQSFGKGPEPGAGDEQTIAELGLTMHSTLGDLMRLSETETHGLGERNSRLTLV